MPYKNPEDIPIGMRKVYRRLQGWRSVRRGRTPIPKSIWAAAAAAAREHGVFRTSKVLGLEFNKLKGCVESERPNRRQKANPAPQFLESMTAAPAGGSECVIELEAKHGKMRIHWKGITASDLAELSRILWERM